MNFWHLCTTSRYTRKLEAENAELKARLTDYERILIPRLVVRSVEANPPRTESVDRAESRERSESSSKPVRTGRKGWQWSRARLEELHNPEVSGKEIRL